MTKRKYNKIIKLLDKIMILLKEEVNYKRNDYTEVKIKVYGAYKRLKDNKNWWVK